MSINLSALMKQRYDTAANWTGQNPTLLAGEIGIESDTKKWKVGTGATAWTSLVYAIGGTYPIVNADVAAGAAIVDTKLATIATAGKVSNSATTATHVNTGSTIVARDASGNFSAGSITASLNGIAAFVSTNANLNGDVTSVGNTTAIAAGVIVDADVNASAGIVDTKLATIATAGKVSNSATTAASANTASAIVARDASGNFTAGTITAALTGAASANVLKAGDTMTGVLAVTAGTAALPGIAVSGDPNTGIYSPGADQLAISTNGTEKLIVKSDGKVGLGTTGPGGIFHTLTTGLDNVNFFERASGAKFGIYNSTTTSYIGTFSNHDLRFATNDSEKVRIDTSGRLLVGTTDGSGGVSKLVVQGASNGSAVGVAQISYNGLSSAVLATDTDIGYLRFTDQGSNSGVFAQITASTDGTTGAGDYPGRLVFSTTADGAPSPTERMRITSGGQAQLVGDGLLIASIFAAGTSAVILQGYHSATAGSQGSGTVSFRVYNNGNVQNTNNSYGAISDIKLKENIVDANSQWNDLKALQVRKYNFKEGQTHTQIGLVAQEAELVSPGLVSESPDRDEEGNDLGTVTKSVNYSVLYMKAVKALQEAMERIEALEADVAALKGA
jgi:hypothetical protein